MRAIDRHDGLVALLDRNDVDTDAILPKQFMKSISRSGYGAHVFDEWRYTDSAVLGTDCSTRPLNTAFELNQQRYLGASILLTRRNFGCGSSREHAVWGLLEYGFHVLIGESFADIFRSNCVNNGVLTIPLSACQIEHLVMAVNANLGYRLSIRLGAQYLEMPDGNTLAFDIPRADKERLMAGLDAVGNTLRQSDKIAFFEKQQKAQFPWLY